MDCKILFVPLEKSCLYPGEQKKAKCLNALDEGEFL